MYKELIESFAQNNEWVKVQPPQTEENIRATEAVVGYLFPKELRDLYLEMDGDSFLFLSLQKIAETVQINRETWLPFFEEDYSKEEYMDRVDRFIFFAGNGCGDYYCYRVSPDGIADESVIYIWEHEYIGEPCCWKPVTSNLKELIMRYYNDEI